MLQILMLQNARLKSLREKLRYTVLLFQTSSIHHKRQTLVTVENKTELEDCEKMTGFDSQIIFVIGRASKVH